MWRSAVSYTHLDVYKRQDQFKDKFRTDIPNKNQLLELVKKDIEDIANFAIAPYFWFVSSKELEVLDSSDNIHHLTPFGKDEWQKHYPNFLQHIIPPEDFTYFFGSSAFMVEYLEPVSYTHLDVYKRQILNAS